MSRVTPTLSGLALFSVPMAWIALFLLDIPQAIYIIAGGMILYVLLQMSQFTKTAWVVFSGCICAGSIAGFFVDDLWATLLIGSERSGLVVSIFAAGACLRRIAEQSTMIHRCGAHLIAQPPGRRYGALTFGTAAIGIFMSFGCVNLLGPMIRKTRDDSLSGAAADQQAQREQRGMVAIFRGFCMSSVISPISFTFAFGLSYAPGAEPALVLLIAISCGICLIFLGWLLDARSNHAKKTAAPQSTDPAADGWSIQLRLLALIATILTGIFSVVQIWDLRLIDGVVISLPTAAVIWLIVQSVGQPSATAYARTNIIALIREQFPSYRMEIMILTLAGIAGSLIAAALPLDDIAQSLKAANLPAAVIPMIVVGFMALCGQLAMNSVLSATIIASILPAPILLGADPSLVAASYMIGWGITVSSSPYSLSTLMIANIHGSNPRTVAYGWNKRFVPLAILFVASYMGIVSYILT